MPKSICSAKLSELDSKLARLHGQINGFDGVSSERLKEEISLLSEDIREHRNLVQNSLDHIRIDLSEEVKRDLSSLVHCTDDIIQKVHEEFFQETDPEARAEKQALLAEYALDVAIISAESALLASLEAMDAERAADKED